MDKAKTKNQALIKIKENNENFRSKFELTQPKTKLIELAKIFMSGFAKVEEFNGFYEVV